MVAYSFKARFAAPIRSGEKQQTIRAHRKRHAREGEELQLYFGMRTRHCILLGTALCRSVERIVIDVEGGSIHFPRTTETITQEGEMDAFANRDGFHDWLAMQSFWRAEHPSIRVFDGVLIRWQELLPPPSP
jgi:hypothetical protein